MLEYICVHLEFLTATTTTWWQWSMKRLSSGYMLAYLLNHMLVCQTFAPVTTAMELVIISFFHEIMLHVIIR